MKAKNISIDIRDAIKDTYINVRIKGIGIAKIRMFIGAKLIKFAVWVIGCKTEIEVNG